MFCSQNFGDAKNWGSTAHDIFPLSRGLACQPSPFRARVVLGIIITKTYYGFPKIADLPRTVAPSVVVV